MACGPEDCRYGVYDFEYQHQCQGTSEKTMKEKLLLMSWCPDTARIKKKMLYSSSFDALKKCLVGVQKYIQVILIMITLYQGQIIYLTEGRSLSTYQKVEVLHLASALMEHFHEGSALLRLMWKSAKFLKEQFLQEVNDWPLSCGMSKPFTSSISMFNENNIISKGEAYL